jgi:hypothetical protein
MRKGWIIATIIQVLLFIPIMNSEASASETFDQPTVNFPAGKKATIVKLCKQPNVCDEEDRDKVISEIGAKFCRENGYKSVQDIEFSEKTRDLTDSLATISKETGDWQSTSPPNTFSFLAINRLTCSEYSYTLKVYDKPIFRFSNEKSLPIGAYCGLVENGCTGKHEADLLRTGSEFCRKMGYEHASSTPSLIKEGKDVAYYGFSWGISSPPVGFLSLVAQRIVCAKSDVDDGLSVKKSVYYNPVKIALGGGVNSRIGKSCIRCGKYDELSIEKFEAKQYCNEQGYEHVLKVEVEEGATESLVSYSGLNARWEAQRPNDPLGRVVGLSIRKLECGNYISKLDRFENPEWEFSAEGGQNQYEIGLGCNSRSGSSCDAIDDNLMSDTLGLQYCKAQGYSDVKHLEYILKAGPASFATLNQNGLWIKSRVRNGESFRAISSISCSTIHDKTKFFERAALRVQSDSTAETSAHIGVECRGSNDSCTLSDEIQLWVTTAKEYCKINGFSGVIDVSYKSGNPPSFVTFNSASQKFEQVIRRSQRPTLIAQSVLCGSESTIRTRPSPDMRTLSRKPRKIRTLSGSDQFCSVDPSGRQICVVTGSRIPTPPPPEYLNPGRPYPPDHPWSIPCTIYGDESKACKDCKITSTSCGSAPGSYSGPGTETRYPTIPAPPQPNPNLSKKQNHKFSDTKLVDLGFYTSALKKKISERYGNIDLITEFKEVADSYYEIIFEMTPDQRREFLIENRLEELQTLFENAVDLPAKFFALNPEQRSDVLAELTLDMSEQVFISLAKAKLRNGAANVRKMAEKGSPKDIFNLGSKIFGTSEKNLSAYSELVQNAELTGTRSTGLRNFVKSGGYVAAEREFSKFQFDKVEEVSGNIKIGYLPNGNKVVLRPSSTSTGEPTVEFQRVKANGKTDIEAKIRYQK